MIEDQCLFTNCQTKSFSHGSNLKENKTEDKKKRDKIRENIRFLENSPTPNMHDQTEPIIYHQVVL